MGQTCFVIMGFGKKTDYYGDNPRTLDLDASYEAIIKPAVDACPNLECIRADKVLHSGIIDKPMYEMLLQADIVIADISTANPNALYELGVRHALRPRTTIVIKEIDGKFPFDLNHIATLQYKHLGDDIGAREARTKIEELRQLIEAVRRKTDADSPVYTFLSTLREPTAAQEERGEAPNVAATAAAAGLDRLANAIEEGRRALAENRPRDARDRLREALQIQTDAQAALNKPGTPQTTVIDPFVVQQLALATQRAKDPDPTTALKEAWTIIEQLGPATSTDPETLGIAGSIRKRLWQAAHQRADLDSAIDFYGRGFELKRDYYTGENFAVCLDWRAEVQSDAAEAAYDRTTARKARARIVSSLEAALQDESAKERADYHWMVGTMANTLRALGRNPEADGYEAKFLEIAPLGDRQTFEEGKRAAIAIASRPT